MIILGRVFWLLLLASLMSSATWALDSDLTELRSAETTLGQPGDETLKASLNERGVCAIRGGAGQFLIPIDFKTQAECQASCASFADRASRFCEWKGARFFGDPPMLCLVKGGARKLLSSTIETFAGCQKTCANFTANRFRSCDWGKDRFFQQGAETDCRVLSFEGKILLNPTYAADETICRTACDQFTDPDRRCLIAGKVIKEWDPARKCEIWGGAGKVLRPVFYGEKADCAQSCASFNQNPARTCWYGQQRIQ